MNFCSKTNLYLQDRENLHNTFVAVVAQKFARVPQA